MPYQSQIWKKASITIYVSFGANTIGIEITPINISVFEPWKTIDPSNRDEHDAVSG